MSNVMKTCCWGIKHTPVLGSVLCNVDIGLFCRILPGVLFEYLQHNTNIYCDQSCYGPEHVFPIPDKVCYEEQDVIPGTKCNVCRKVRQNSFIWPDQFCH